MEGSELILTESSRFMLFQLLNGLLKKRGHRDHLSGARTMKRLSPYFVYQQASHSSSSLV